MSEEATEVTRPPDNLIAGVVRAVRPRQWVKNLLVLAAPLFALGGAVKYDYRHVLINVSIAFVVFCMAASAVYLINDVRDVEADRAHPTKRFRPIAAGVVPEWLAYTLATALGGEVRYDYRAVLINVSVAFVVFCMAASAVYLINDVRDVEADRQH